METPYYRSSNKRKNKKAKETLNERTAKKNGKLMFVTKIGKQKL